MGRFGDYEEDRESRTPLDDLAENIESREGRRRDRRAGIFSVSQTGLWLLGAISIAVLAMMITSTVMLWQIADRTGSDSGSGSINAQLAEPPPLPSEETRGTSSKELLGEFDRLGTDISSPVKALNSQIESTNQVFGAVSGSLNQLVVEAQGFSGAQETLEQVADSTKQLDTVSKSLKNLNRDVGTFDSVAGNTKDMSNSIGTMIGKLEESNTQLGSLASVDAQMKQMNSQLGTLGSMDTQMKEMNSTLQSMNSMLVGVNDLLPRLEALLNAICASEQIPC